MFSPFNPFSEDEWDRLNAWLDRIYADFTTKVAQGRRLPVERVHDIARGRVWTGLDAHDRGLVDELGGLDHAIAVARDRAGLEPTERPNVRTYPHVPMVARLRPPQSSEDPAAASIRLRVEALGRLRRAGHPARPARLRPAHPAGQLEHGMKEADPRTGAAATRPHRRRSLALGRPPGHGHRP